MRATLVKKITPEMVLEFARLFNDHNPIHVDAEYAAQTRFKKPIAHGPLIAGFIGALVATELPGPGSIYVKQDLRFVAPIYVGDDVEILVEIAEVIDAHRMRLRAQCYSDARLAIDGEIVVYL